MIRLNDLNNFIEASGFPSLSMASKKLGVTQPALSESIKRLEKDLETVLFYRTKNGISLTPEGKKALEKSKSIRIMLNDLGEMRSDQKQPLLTLGCHPAIGSYFLPYFIKRVNHTIPEGRFKITHDLSRNIQLQVQSGEIDFGIIVNPSPNPDLILKHIGVDMVRVWKSKKKGDDNKIIADLDLLQTQNILNKWKRAPKELMSMSSLEIIARMTNQGCGYGIIPERTVKLLNFDLEIVKGSPCFKDEFYLVYRPEFGKTRYEKDVIKLIVESFS